MASNKREPPNGHGQLSWNSVAADGFDFPRDNPTGPKKQVSAAPPDFDPAACPIISRHWFGIPAVDLTVPEFAEEAAA